MSTETMVMNTQDLFQCVFLEGFGMTLRPGAWPLKVGDRLFISDSRIMLDLAWEPVPRYREIIDGKRTWFENGVEKEVTSKEWIGFDTMMSKQIFDCSFAVPFIPQPAGTAGSGWLVSNICDGCDGKGSYAGFVCQDCDGLKEVLEEADAASYPVKYQGISFAARLLWIIGQLPNAKLGKPFPQDPMTFVFDGGRGIVMPMSRIVQVGYPAEVSL